MNFDHSSFIVLKDAGSSKYLFTLSRLSRTIAPYSGTPVSDALIVEIKVPPQDVDQLRRGQRAVVRFSAFNRRTTPELNGEVIEIGADVTQDETRNESYYAVRIRIPDGELERLDGLQPLAGMPVETFIETAPRTGVSYLMTPMLEQIERTFRGR